MPKNPPIADPGDKHLAVSKPKRWAAGVPAVAAAMKHSLEQMGPRRTVLTLLDVNQAKGFDCPGCAWPEPDPEHRHKAEFCENGAKAVAEEATKRRITREFFARYPVSELATKSDYWLGQQGRLTEPMVKRPGSDRYEPISWDDAFGLVADELTRLDNPDQAVFYTSGRTSNEAAFLYQLFARAYGTNNMPDCSNMCHESSGVALQETLGVGKGSVTLEDLYQADLILVAGQNPGTNHPRMLSALEKAKANGARIVAINPLPEAGLLRFKNPQRPRGVLGSGTPLADLFLQIRLGGDLALFQALNRLLLEAEDARPGTVLDREFIERYTDGFEDFAAHVRKMSWDDALAATGLTRPEIEQLHSWVLASERIIVCWAMGLTQHKHSVPMIREIVNFLALRGNLGRPGAGVCPVRGHSNVQGDRTMGIWEKPPAWFLDALQREFGFEPPRHHGYDTVHAIEAMLAGDVRVFFAMGGNFVRATPDGYDTVHAIEAMLAGDVRVFFAMGGNFVRATPDSARTEEAMRRLRLTVHVSTKLNRSHTVTGEIALILPTLGRTELDVQASGPQFVTVEDSMGSVHASRGRLAPASPRLLSEVSIICRLARRVLGDRVSVPWEEYEADYSRIRDRIAKVVPGFEDFNAKVTRPGGFLLPHPVRERRFPTPTGKARFTRNELEVIRVPDGHLLLQTLRSHDQYNTTIYGLDDRYRGVSQGRRVVFVHPEDLAALGFTDGDLVDLVSVWEDGERRAEAFRAVAYPTARGCAATYFPEANVLVPLGSRAEGSNTPTSKSIIVRLERAAS
ncbi:FdhF/YdeP family oxidoreductase [Carbonactinospora thermoautotrophica]|uniref:FdhF/YdeP family oxidoreductase n=1 Tax=Carbonactinospora thermoautotrophica TaxID=1469144 RepID=UPI003DA85514